MPEFCECDIVSGYERNALGVKVCERCGKADDPRDGRPVRSSAKTYWNGEPASCVRVVVRVGAAERSTHWHNGLEGTERTAVAVTYGGQRFYLDDEDGSGWLKVTEGHGGPRWPHRSLPGSSTIVARL